MKINEEKIRLICTEFFGNVPIDIINEYYGKINHIIKIHVSGKFYGLRVRINESIFKYERNIFKETAINSWLHSDKKNELIKEKLNANVSVGKPNLLAPHNNILPNIVYDNFSCDLIPYPYCIYEWHNGSVLWEHKDKNLYYLAGKTLKTIHNLQFDAFYCDFNAIGKTKLDWKEKFNLSLENELILLATQLPSANIKSINNVKYKISDNVDAIPCLIHNDFHGGNIIVNDGNIQTVIDWDNAVIDSYELDFIKMKYWTVKDRNGFLAHDQAFFDAFIEGYGASDALINSPLFMCYEILWLARIINFESSSKRSSNPQLEEYKQRLNDKTKEYLENY